MQVGRTTEVGVKGVARRARAARGCVQNAWYWWATTVGSVVAALHVCVAKHPCPLKSIQ